MSDGTGIEWTDATWNPVTGCSVVNSGCTHCYATRLAGGRLRNHPSRAGLTLYGVAGPIWTGEVRFNRQWIEQPLRWKRPRRIFVCTHGDLFHESVPDEWIDNVFAMMALSPRHIFQVLTKRPGRMREYQNRELRAFAESIGEVRIDLARNPVPNVWLGVSVEDQQWADEWIHVLLDTPAAIRFLSIEPLLGPVHLVGNALPSKGWNGHNRVVFRGVDWVIAGGESGPGARPMDPAWVRRIREDCRRARVPLYFKRWGETSRASGRLLDGVLWNRFPFTSDINHIRPGEIT